MELRHLRYFAALAQELSFTRAAERLHVSQPPLSQQIRALEEELGTRLFERTSRRVELTPAGQAFLVHARAILQRAERAMTETREVGAGTSGRVAIGLTSSILLGPLPGVIAAFCRRYPGVSVTLSEMPPRAQAEAIADGQIDACFSRSPLDDAATTNVLAWRDPLLVALPRNHRLARRRSIGLRELRDEPFVALVPGSSPFADNLHKWCVAAGFAPRIAQEVLESQSIPALVAAGLGVALVPASVRRAPHEVAYRPLCDRGVSADVYLSYRSKNPSAALSRLVELTLDLLARSGGAQPRWSSTTRSGAKPVVSPG